MNLIWQARDIGNLLYSPHSLQHKSVGFQLRSCHRVSEGCSVRSNLKTNYNYKLLRSIEILVILSNEKCLLTNSDYPYIVAI